MSVEPFKSVSRQCYVDFFQRIEFKGAGHEEFRMLRFCHSKGEGFEGVLSDWGE